MELVYEKERAAVKFFGWFNVATDLKTVYYSNYFCTFVIVVVFLFSNHTLIPC